MKPKTKQQKKIVALAEKVKPLAQWQKQWATDKLFTGRYVRIRKTNDCLECGHKWRAYLPPLAWGIVDEECPGCGCTLRPVTEWNRSKKDRTYWAILDVIKGHQLVRMVIAEKYMKRGRPAQYTHREVMQHWIGPDGTITSLLASCQAMGYYADTWIPGENKLEVRGKSDKQDWLCGLVPDQVCPKRKVLPIIRRNGYKGHFYGMAPHKLFTAILTSPKAETLLKAGQISLLKEYLRKRPKVEYHWRSICIAIRHNYCIINASDWMDHLQLLNRFGKDLRNPRYICPDDLAADHTRYTQKAMREDKRIQLMQKKAEIYKDEPVYAKSKSRFFDLHIKANDLDVVPLRSVYEFYEEAEKLEHCLWVNKYYKRDDSLILSARVGGEPVETIEVDLNSLKVVQAMGLHNLPTEKHHVIVDLVTNNMQHIARMSQQKNL